MGRARGGQLLGAVPETAGAGPFALPAATPPEFRALYREQLAYVFRTLRRLGAAPADVDDLVQEVFTVVFKRLSDYDPRRPIQPWLFGIAFRVASMHHRSRSRRVTEVAGDPIELTADDAPGPEASLADRQSRRLVLEALEALDLPQRGIFVMHDIDGQSVPEIAEALSIPLNTVYSRLRAARAHFTSRVRQLRLAAGQGEKAP
jgi:RNA polymerase sigma-70 factor (ECF subfamily)